MQPTLDFELRSWKSKWRKGGGASDNRNSRNAGSGSACQGTHNLIPMVLMLSGSIALTGQHSSAQIREVLFWLLTTRNSN